MQKAARNPKGLCNECGRYFAIRTDGRIRAHWDSNGPCIGSLTKPDQLLVDATGAPIVIGKDRISGACARCRNAPYPPTYMPTGREPVSSTYKDLLELRASCA